MMNKLYQGQVFKNYKELCKVMDWKYQKSGNNSKIAQFKEFNTLCTYHKEGNKIIIDEVFDNIKDKIDGRNNRRLFSELFDYLNTSGVYMITDRFGKSYIGSSNNIYKRFIQHNKDIEISRSKLLDKDSMNITVIESTRGIQDRELLYQVEAMIIEEGFAAGMNLVNLRNSVSSQKRNIPIFKTIKIDSKNYDRAMELLQIHNLI